jgi:hypothetical protein
MARLRREGEIDQGIFKLRHLGIVEVTTKSGDKYSGCDKVLVFDVKLEKAKTFEALVNETFGAIYQAEMDEINPVKFGSVKDVEVVLFISSRVPALGAVKIDASGKVYGMEVKAGFDYMSPGSVDSDPVLTGKQ